MRFVSARVCPLILSTTLSYYFNIDPMQIHFNSSLPPILPISFIRYHCIISILLCYYYYLLVQLLLHARVHNLFLQTIEFRMKDEDDATINKDASQVIASQESTTTTTTTTTTTLRIKQEKSEPVDHNEATLHNAATSSGGVRVKAEPLGSVAASSSSSSSSSSSASPSFSSPCSSSSSSSLSLPPACSDQSQLSVVARTKKPKHKREKHVVAESSSKDVCAICLGSFVDQDTGKPNACDHTFCFDCILEWSKVTTTTTTKNNQIFSPICNLI